MSKKLQLSIPTPCHENWDAMTPVEKGKFCGSCQKQVVDFSNMSDRQVAEFFKKPSTGSVCGRFMSDQLERDIEIPRKRIPWLKYFFQFAIPAFLVSIKVSAEKTQGAVSLKVATKDTTKNGGVFSDQRITLGMVARPTCTKPLMGDIDIYPPGQLTKLSGTIQLKVVGEKGEPIPYASVESGVIGKGGAADKNGLFNLDKSILNINGKIFVSSAGYERKEVQIKTISGVTGTFTIELQIKGWLDEVVVSTFGIRRCERTLGFVSRVEVSQLTDNNVINGKVIDENGYPLPGASVILKGTRTGVPTDNNGAFALAAKKGDVLQVLGAGLELTEAAITDDRNIIICVRRIVLGEISVKKYSTKKELKKVPLIPAISSDKQFAVIRIFPNPVLSGSSINIEWKQTEEGYYSLQLLNQSGQSIHQKEIWIDAEARLLSIDVPPVAAGSYFLVLTNKKSGKRFTEKIIVQ